MIFSEMLVLLFDCVMDILEKMFSEWKEPPSSKSLTECNEFPTLYSFTLGIIVWFMSLKSEMGGNIFKIFCETSLIFVPVGSTTGRIDTDITEEDVVDKSIAGEVMFVCDVCVCKCEEGFGCSRMGPLSWCFIITLRTSWNKDKSLSSGSLIKSNNNLVILTKKLSKNPIVSGYCEIINWYIISNSINN